MNDNEIDYENDKIVTKGKMVITAGPNGEVVLAFGQPVDTVGFSIPEVMILVVGMMETCLQIISEANTRRDAEKPN